MNRLNYINYDLFKEKFDEDFLCFFIVQNYDFNLNNQIFDSTENIILFEDFKESAHEISPKICVVSNFEDFVLIFEVLKEINRLSFVFSDQDQYVVFDEFKKILEIRVKNLGKFLFRFYDNYVLDYTFKVIESNERKINLGKFLSEWYWSDLEGNIFFIQGDDLDSVLKPLSISELDFKKINNYVYPFSLIPKFKDYSEYADFKTNNNNDYDWYSEVVKRIELAKERGFLDKKDIELYAILSFGLGDGVFDRSPLDLALKRAISDKISLESSLNEVKLSN